MQIMTKHFGEIEIDENKVITFTEGLFGLLDYKKYVIVYDNEDNNAILSWLQSLDDSNIALPIINPLFLGIEYNPTVEDELLKDLGEYNENAFLIFCVAVIPEDIKKMTINRKAPIIIHTDTKKARQIIVENEDYEIKYPIYEHIIKIKEQLKAGE